MTLLLLLAYVLTRIAAPIAIPHWPLVLEQLSILHALSSEVIAQLETHTILLPFLSPSHMTAEFVDSSAFLLPSTLPTLLCISLI